MHPYLPYLLDDLTQAKTNKPDRPNYRLLYPDHPAFEYGLDYIVEWEMGLTKQLKDWVVLEKEIFPPPEHLTEDEMRLVITSFIKLLNHFNVDVALPEKIPVPDVYQLLINTLDHEIQIVSEATMTIDFCSGNAEGCELGSFCSCKDIDFESMDIPEKNNDELPF